MAEDLVFLPGLGRAVSREALASNPELEALLHRAVPDAEALAQQDFERALGERARRKRELEEEFEAAPGSPGAAAPAARTSLGSCAENAEAGSRARRTVEDNVGDPDVSANERRGIGRLRTPDRSCSRYCARCRRVLPNETRLRGSPRKFCSASCRKTAYREKQARKATRAGVDVVAALSDPKLLGAAFGSLETWGVWLAFLKSLFGLELEDAELEVFQRHTGRSVAPVGQAREAWVVAGRRGGKSRVAALAAVFLACFREYSEVLAKGERGTLMVIAAGACVSKCW